MGIVTLRHSWSEAARKFNRDSYLDCGTRYERAAEFDEVVTNLSPAKTLSNSSRPNCSGANCSDQDTNPCCTEIQLRSRM
jgi:hypothetical protein